MSDMSSNDLSERELEILRLVATGASNKEIAQQLYISTNTVKVHLRNIFDKMQVSSRTEATVAAIKGGIVEALKEELDSLDTMEKGQLEDLPENGLVTSSEQIASTGKQSNWLRAWWWLIPIGLGLLAVVGILLSRPPAIFPTVEATETQQTATLVAAENLSDWEYMTPMLTPRGRFGSTLLDDQIFVIGGENTTGVVNVVESYDIRQNTWTMLPPKPTAVAEIQAVNIGSRIFVPGGRLSDGRITNIHEVYDPQTNDWERKADLPFPLCAYAAAEYEGKFYLFGGWDGQKYLNTVLEYDPNEDLWREKTSMPTARGYAKAVLLEERIHVLGGKDDQQVYAVHESYMPSLDDSLSQPWRNDVPLPAGRHSFGATSAVGLIYLVGGEGDSPTAVLPSLVLLSTSGEWQTFSIPEPSSKWSASGLQYWGTDIFQFGGYLNDEPTGNNASYQVIMLTILPIIQP
jgi:DNA-binding CsgD family transcriptional regulator